MQDPILIRGNLPDYFFLPRPHRSKIVYKANCTHVELFASTRATIRDRFIFKFVREL